MRIKVFEGSVKRGRFSVLPDGREVHSARPLWCVNSRNVRVSPCSGPAGGHEVIQRGQRWRSGRPFPASFRRANRPSASPAPPLCAADLRLIYLSRYCSPLHYLERRRGGEPLGSLAGRPAAPPAPEKLSGWNVHHGAGARRWIGWSRADLSCCSCPLPEISGRIRAVQVGRQDLRTGHARPQSSWSETPLAAPRRSTVGLPACGPGVIYLLGGVAALFTVQLGPDDRRYGGGSGTEGPTGRSADVITA